MSSWVQEAGEEAVSEPVNTVADFKVDQNVELHPGTDRWMMGDRMGIVKKLDPANGRVRVKLDVSGKSLWFKPDDILSKKTRNP